MLPLTQLGHSRQGQPNEMEGGVKWASSPCVGMESQRSTTPMRNAPTYREVSTPTMEGWIYTLQSSQAKMTAKQKQQSMRSCSFKEWGVVHTEPLKTLHLTINTDSHYTYSKLLFSPFDVGIWCQDGEEPGCLPPGRGGGALLQRSRESY